MSDTKYTIGHTTGGFTHDEIFMVAEAAGEYLDKLLDYSPIFRIANPREIGEEPPHTWMIPTIDIMGSPIWEETDEHFSIRVWGHLPLITNRSKNITCNKTDL